MDSEGAHGLRIDDLYGPDVLAAIDGNRAALKRHEHGLDQRTVRLSPGRSLAVGAAVTQAIVAGVADALEPERNEVFEEIDPGLPSGPPQFVTLYFVPNNPQATVAVVRPWLQAS